MFKKDDFLALEVAVGVVVAVSAGWFLGGALAGVSPPDLLESTIAVFLGSLVLAVFALWIVSLVQGGSDV